MQRKMRVKHKKERLLVLCPAVVGIVASVWLNKTNPDLPVMVVRLDVASLILLISIILSIRLSIHFRRAERIQKQYENIIEDELTEHRQFLRRLDHELKNPLSAITTRIATINNTVSNESSDKELEEPEKPQNQINEIQQMVFQIDEQTQRIKRLISDLRKLSELETCTLELTAVDPNPVLEQCYQDLKSHPAYCNKNILLSIPNTPWVLPKIRVDEDLVYIVLQNLLDNAVKYTREGDTIELRAYELHDQVVIEVADSGIGIPVDEIANIGNELYRAKNARGIPGNGLGLSIVKTIVKRLDGEFTLRSKDSAGTVVSIQLPKFGGE
ncbi:MAG: HAMP domain-containing histidine kinase [Chloroflexi bacterium]|nr:HAMP domain-containing histidine kinase [Chloroflexota bacterium]